MPTAKSAPAPQTNEVKSEPVHSGDAPQQVGNTMEFAGIPVDMYRYFGIDLGSGDEKELNKVKEIYEWAKKDSESLGDAMTKISRLERQLGSPHINETRHTKMWLWVKLTRQMEDLDKRRESMRKTWA